MAGSCFAVEGLLPVTAPYAFHIADKAGKICLFLSSLKGCWYREWWVPFPTWKVCWSLVP